MLGSSSRVQGCLRSQRGTPLSCTWPIFVTMVTCDLCHQPHSRRGSQGPGNRHSGGSARSNGKGASGQIPSQRNGPESLAGGSGGTCWAPALAGREAHPALCRGKQESCVFVL